MPTAAACDAWRFLIRAAAYAALSDFTANRKIVLKRRMTSLNAGAASRNLSARFAGIYPANYLPMRSRRYAALAVGWLH